MSDIRDDVRQRYAQAATSGSECCGSAAFGSSLYEDADLSEVPQGAAKVSLGCGNPTAVADLREGETVLDLGSGGGIDVILSAKRVGPSGKAFGLDMTDEMLTLAIANAKEAGAGNVQFLKGYIEDIPLPAATVDVVISNCVVNLSPDKPRVIAEIARVLAPGGRLGLSDIVADDHLTPDERAERGSYTGCIAGALSFAEYRTLLEANGFERIRIQASHQVADGMHSAIIQAEKPSTALAPQRATLPLATTGCC